jgi:quinol monooxygenase YgiN
MTTRVEANEPGCLSYQYFYNEAEDEFAVFEM